jgi:hypothetical protein
MVDSKDILSDFYQVAITADMKDAIPLVKYVYGYPTSVFVRALMAVLTDNARIAVKQKRKLPGDDVLEAIVKL